MAYQPRIGFGGKLEIDTAYPSTPNWVEVGEVIDFNCNIDIAEVDVTHQQSVTVAPFYKEWIPGAVSVELSFTVIWDPGATEHENCVLDHLGVTRQFRYTFNDDKGTGDTVWTFAGFYRGPSVSVPNEDKLTSDITIRVTGSPTFAGTAIS